MRFDWDPAKNERTVRERGLPFAYAVRIFDGPIIEQEDTRRDYGETRIVALGVVDGREYVVVYTDRRDAEGPVRWIISARKAKPKEQGRYRGLYPR